MLSKIKQFFLDRKELADLKAKNTSLLKLYGDPTFYMHLFIKGGLEWFDYTKQAKQLWKVYFADAQSIAANQVFNNELNHYIADLIKFIAEESRSHEETMAVRQSIIALKTFKKRLEDIEDPEKSNPTTDDLNSPI